jgi:hypothetical protein
MRNTTPIRTSMGFRPQYKVSDHYNRLKSTQALRDRNRYDRKKAQNTQRRIPGLDLIQDVAHSSEELTSEKRRNRRRSARQIQNAVRRRNQRRSRAASRIQSARSIRPARARRSLLSQAAQQLALNKGVDPTTGDPISLSNAYIGLNPVQSARLKLQSNYGDRRPRARLDLAAPSHETPSQTEERRRLAYDQVLRDRAETSWLMTPQSGISPDLEAEAEAEEINRRFEELRILHEISDRQEAARKAKELEQARVASRLLSQPPTPVVSHDPFGTGARDAQRVASEIAGAAMNAGTNFINSAVSTATSPEAQGLAMMARDIGSAALSMFAPGGRRTVSVPAGARVRYTPGGIMDIDPDDQDPSSRPGGGSRRRSRRRTKRNKRTKKR